MAKANLLKDDLIPEIEPMESVEESVTALILNVAERVEKAAYGNVGVLKGYADSLRDGSDAVTSAVLANVPAPTKTRK